MILVWFRLCLYLVFVYVRELYREMWLIREVGAVGVGFSGFIF